MTLVSDEILAEIVQTIVAEVDPERIYLFGSRARGDERPDSDVDLLIVDRKPSGPEYSPFRPVGTVDGRQVVYGLYPIACGSLRRDATQWSWWSRATGLERPAYRHSPLRGGVVTFLGSLSPCGLTT
jgi:hypothetical protein